MTNELQDQIEVEWLILADYAQVVGGKLYLMGGGWDRLTINKIPARQNLGIAISIQVPWNETNRPHNFGLQILDADANMLVATDGQFEVGRPVGAPTMQRSQLAMNIGMAFKKLGTYVIIATLNEKESKRFTFNVVPGPQLLMQQKEQQS